MDSVIKTGAGGDSSRVELIAASVPDRIEAAGERLARLFRDHLDVVWRTARRFGLSSAEAEDAAQQVFLVASKRLPDIPTDAERSFLVGAAINVARTMLRSKLRKREDLVEEHDAMDGRPNPEELLGRARACAAADRIVASMPEDLRVAFVLFELEEMTMIEVSEVLGIPAGTVASRIRRARDVFRAAVAAMGAP